MKRLIVLIGTLFFIMSLATGVFAKTTLQYWTLFTGPDGKVMSQLVEEFNKQHPDIKAVMQILPWGEPYYSRLTTSIVSGKAPDLAICHGYILPRFASKKSFYPITEADLEEMDLREDMFIGPVWQNASAYEGLRYGIPLDYSGMGIYWNSDLLKEAGLPSEIASLPESGEDFVTWLKKLTVDTDGDGKIDRWGMIAPLDWFRESSFYSGIWQNDGEVLSEDKKTCFFNSEASHKSLQFLVDLIHKHKVMSPELAQNPFLAFYQAKAATMQSGPWEVLGVEATKGLNYTISNHPLLGPEKAYIIYSHMLVRPKQRKVDPEKKKACFTFIRWLSDNNIGWVEAGQCPSRLDAQANKAFKTFRSLRVQRTVAQQGEYGHYTPKIVQYQEMRRQVINAMELALLGKKTVSEALDALEKQVNAILAK